MLIKEPKPQRAHPANAHIYLPPELDERLRVEAKERRWTLASTIKWCCEEWLAQLDRERAA